MASPPDAATDEDGAAPADPDAGDGAGVSRNDAAVGDDAAAPTGPDAADEASGALTAEQARALDLATLFAGLGGANVRITRIRSDVAHAAMTTDLILQASSDQSELSNVRVAAQSVNEQCPILPRLLGRRHGHARAIRRQHSPRGLRDDDARGRRSHGACGRAGRRRTPPLCPRLPASPRLAPTTVLKELTRTLLPSPDPVRCNRKLRVSILLMLSLASAVAFAAGYALAVQRARSHEREITPPIAFDSDARPPAERLAFSHIAPEGSPEWRLAMADLGARMKAMGVKLVVFVHGSFVGDDPLSIAGALDEALPLVPEMARALRDFTRAQISRLVGDGSNFSADYIASFAAATGIEAKDFTWSGSSHHVARIQGAVRLARALALHGGGALGPDDGLLLVGHSHGGQLFAILSQLTARSRGHHELLEAAAAIGEDVDALQGHLALLRRWAVDVATFGTPPRYGWARGARFRLLHVVNHRGVRDEALSMRGVLHTHQGDYIHQLGTHGSDLPALHAKERSLNARLDRVLGIGSDLRAWVHHLARSFRVSPEGHTVLVDYGDASTARPNFWATGFGHAAYTRREAMLFHTRLVVDHFYPHDARSVGRRRLEWLRPRPLLPRRGQGPPG